MEIQYAEKGNEKYAGFGNNVAAIRDLSLGMELDKALALVGFSFRWDCVRGEIRQRIYFLDG
jgi:hypothetical protein